MLDGKTSRELRGSPKAASDEDGLIVDAPIVESSLVLIDMA